MSGDRIVSTRLRCPKCKSANLDLVESGTWTTSWEVNAGKFDRDEGYHTPGSIDRLDANCLACRHQWKPRGAFQIDHVVSQEPSA